MLAFQRPIQIAGVNRRLDLEVLILEVAGHGAADAGVVIDHQDARLARVVLAEDALGAGALGDSVHGGWFRSDDAPFNAKIASGVCRTGNLPGPFET